MRPSFTKRKTLSDGDSLYDLQQCSYPNGSRIK